MNDYVGLLTYVLILKQILQFVKPFQKKNVSNAAKTYDFIALNACYVRSIANNKSMKFLLIKLRNDGE